MSFGFFVPAFWGWLFRLYTDLLLWVIDKVSINYGVEK